MEKSSRKNYKRNREDHIKRRGRDKHKRNNKPREEENC
jgi:hypothetical protein